jgi:hypothetical protein
LCKIPFSIFCSVNIMVMISFRFAYHERISFLLQLWRITLLDTLIWVDSYFSLGDCNISFHALLASRFSVAKIYYSDGWPLYVTFCFSLAAFNILCMSCIFSVLTEICPGVFLFWPCLFSVLKASFTFMTLLFPRFAKFSAIILLNMFSVP